MYGIARSPMRKCPDWHFGGVKHFTVVANVTIRSSQAASTNDEKQQQPASGCIALLALVCQHGRGRWAEWGREEDWQGDYIEWGPKEGWKVLLISVPSLDLPSWSLWEIAGTDLSRLVKHQRFSWVKRINVPLASRISSRRIQHEKEWTHKLILCNKKCAKIVLFFCICQCFSELEV